MDDQRKYHPDLKRSLKCPKQNPQTYGKILTAEIMEEIYCFPRNRKDAAGEPGEPGEQVIYYKLINTSSKRVKGDEKMLLWRILTTKRHAI